jgi:hypothetical protein
MVGFPMETSTRRLVTIRRHVPQDRIPEYAEAWAVLHNAATARGAHAWAFASADHRDTYIEFLEFGDDSDVRNDTATVAAISALHARFHEAYPQPLTMEEWVALPTPPRLTPEGE